MWKNSSKHWAHERLQREVESKRLPSNVGLSSIMGTKGSKHSHQDLVTKFTADNDARPEQIFSSQVQRPPEGMPNPRDVPPQMTFLSVPAAVYVDDDSLSTMSADTTTILTKSSRDSSNTNLSHSNSDRRLSSNSSW